MSFSYDKMIPVSPPLELLEAASSCFANAKSYNSTGINPEMINFNRKIPQVIKSMRTHFKFTQGLIYTYEYYVHAFKYARVYFLAMRIELKDTLSL